MQLLHCHLLIHAEIYIHIYIYIYILDTYRRNHKDRRNDKDAGRLLYKIFTSHFIARVRKGCEGFYCERVLGTEHNWNMLTPKLWPSALCLSRSPWLLNRRPRGSLCCVMVFFIASYQHLLWTPNSIGISEGPLGRVWLSLPHLQLQLSGTLLVTAGSSNSTELYNRSTPTRSLKSNV